MQNEKAIAIFGGSFNPPLNSHYNLAKDILKYFENIEKLIFVPVSTKYNKANLIEDKHRYNMLKILCKEEEKFEVSDIELKSDKQLYTIQTLNFFKDKYKKYDIYFIMGTDNLKELKYWKEPEQILKKYKIIVLQRENDIFEDIVNNDDLLKQNEQSLLNAEKINRINLSSTIVRNKIKNNENVDDYIPKLVLEYINKNNLYKLEVRS